VALDLGDHESLAAALMGVYDSQVSGGKRYDLATMGRRRANATYLESHASDKFSSVTFAMDLTALLTSKANVQDLVSKLIEEFRASVVKQLDELSGR